MRVSFAPLKYVVEARTAPDRGFWDAIASFDCERVARDYCNACGASGGADLYRLAVRHGWTWTVVHTAGRAAAALDAATARNHPQAALKVSKPASVSA